LVTVLAIILLALAWPRLKASLHYLPVQAAIDRYWIDRKKAVEQMGGLQQRARESAQMHAHQRYWEGLNLLYLLQASAPGISLSEQREAYDQSILAADLSLALAPVQPRLWMRKAQALNWSSFTSGPAIDAFKMSVYTGRVEPQLFMARLQLGYGRLNAMDDEARGLLADQTQLAWEMRRNDLLRALKRNQLSQSRVEFLLWDTHEDVLAELEEATRPRTR